ncbi:polyhydroxyalkanoate depolymerase [Acidovorax sp. SD340]|uniref:Polyhydroxyalkanoate depolymerase n=1 Tax=Acidovorax facilis TaxID=12917 RepID=A0ABV8DEE5_9BURK|nr:MULTISPECIES: polyhydroxyalkanoate depolymerase [Acidovorax]MBO1006450.1 polyhydroxyalkanoate depolymerase [Acidovorax sp. SD340]MCO4240933.1 polyhydroxyalkanoate depolymerase [Acidovorax facilis]
MLYHIYETQRSLMEPFTDFAQAAAKLFSNPMSPFSESPLAQRMSAGYELLYRLGKDYEKPAFEIHSVDVDGVGVAVHERIEMDKPFCELRRFKRFSDDTATLTKLKTQPVVLIVAPLSGHYATLLRDTVRTMLKDHKVYITDWKNARLVPLADGEFHLDDYVNYVQEFIRHLQGIYGNCHVISVCQPTVPVLAAVSLMASRGETTPLTMTMMGGPIDARKSPTSVNNLATNRSFEWFENNVIYRVPENFPGAGRRVYPGFLQYTGFVAMNPDRHASSHYDYFKDLIKGDDASVEAHRKFYDEYNAVLDMDADYYLETIQTVFQDYKLVHGTWDVRSPDGKIERVRPQDITTTALFTVEGELDDISGSGQTEAAHDLCSGIVRKEQRHLEAKGAGHYGIFSGRRWREVVYPQVRAFILEHEKPQAKIAVPVTETPDDNPPQRTAAAAAAAAATKAVAPVPKAAAKPLVKPVATAAVKTPVKAAAKTPIKPTAKAPAAVATRWVAPAPAATTSKPTGAAAPADVSVATPAKTTVTAAASARTRRNAVRKA